MNNDKFDWLCVICGNQYVERNVWIRINTGEVMQSGPNDNAFCPSCGVEVAVVERRDYHKVRRSKEQTHD